MNVIQATSSFYADYRVRCGAVPLLRDDADSPPEMLLQGIWQHQRLRRDELTTFDGEPVRILHPGFRSVEGGPDFRGAVIRIGNEPIRTGDIEVDLRASGWHAHGHDRNPAFRQVILHVTWQKDRPATGGPPVLSLANHLDAPLGELSLWLGSETAQDLPDEMRGRCCAPLRSLGAAQVEELLRQAALVRLRSKGAALQARARQAGWEQALWEGLFRALGYKNNVWPMHRLGELRARWHGLGPAELERTEARLFGISGLLPADLTRKEAPTDQYVRRLWDLWWRERDTFEDCLLPKELWRLHGLRPANHPVRRIALASRWSQQGDLATRLQHWCAGTGESVAKLAQALLQELQVELDEFWSRHFTFRSSVMPQPQPLLGATRATDLAINVILPWLWVRAAEGRNEAVRQEVERRYFDWPAAEDNSLLRLARQRLFGGAHRGLLRTAAAQQGLIQIVRDFCEHSNALCEHCKLPGLVKEFSGVSSEPASCAGV